MKCLMYRFSSDGWFDYTGFNDLVTEHGFTVTELERHNMTDGQVHFRYDRDGDSFELNGNYWDCNSFVDVVKWIEDKLN